MIKDKAEASCYLLITFLIEVIINTISTKKFNRQKAH